MNYSKSCWYKVSAKINYENEADFILFGIIIIYALVGMKAGGRVATFHVESVMKMAKSGVSKFIN